MSPRALTIILLRLLGIAQICFSLDGLVFVLGQSQMFRAVTIGGPWHGLGISVLALVSRMIIGVILIVIAPQLARLISPDPDHGVEDVSERAIHAGDIYQIAVFVLGIILMLQAVRPVFSAAADRMQQGVYSADTAAALVSAVVRAVAGVALMLGAKGVGNCLQSLGETTERSPTQQFTVGLLLAIVLGCALAFGMLRILLR